MNMQKKKLYLVRDDANLQLFSNKQIFVSLFLYNRKKRFLATNILGIVIFVD